MESIKTYLKEVKKIPLLKNDEERELANAVKKGDTEARQKMVCSNLRLVINIAKKYAHMGIPLVDLIEEGNIGLIKAVDKFKPRKGFRFSTYAAWWIKQAISRSISDKSHLIRLPVYMNEIVVKYRKVLNRFTQKCGRAPTTTEIAEEMGLSNEKVKKIIAWQTKTISLEAPIGNDDEGQVIDLISDESKTTPEENVDRLLNKERVEQLLEVMDEREKEILNLRFGINGGKAHTLSQMAKKLKLSRERIRQIEESALSKLRRFIRMQGEERK